MHVHLDPIGGIAGDMFIAALLDCRPDLVDGALEIPKALGLSDRIQVTHNTHNNGVLTGSKFRVDEVERPHGRHHHTSFRTIRRDIESSELAAGVKERAIDIFGHLARAEAQVHGMNTEEVSFHEVGAVDSIADISTAAHLIEKLGACQWSAGPVPMGSGRIMSQHGILPLPAPATLILLETLAVFDDGIAGERVTPTGAAILKHLNPSPSGPLDQMTLAGSGTGFGNAKLQGLPNILRVMFFEPIPAQQADQISVVTFEIDDQTPEDLAVGLENLRGVSGVLDVTVAPVFSKKGRQAQQIQILTESCAKQAVIQECFAQTTTLGVRFHNVQRRTVKRDHVRVGDIGVKIAERPTGRTAKAEMDDLAAHHPTEALRSMAARTAVHQALQEDRGEAKA